MEIGKGRRYSLSWWRRVNRERQLRGEEIITGGERRTEIPSKALASSRDSLNKDVETNVNFRWSLYPSRQYKLREGPLRKMSAAVENGVETSKPRGVFSRAFAKRAQPFEEGESCGKQMVQGLPRCTWGFFGDWSLVLHKAQ